MTASNAHNAADTDLRASTAVVVMGVSGCGKTTIGRGVAARLGWVFVEGDDLHPEANVAKMASGQPLEDSDRGPWLNAVGHAMRAALAAGEPGVVAGCSALKRRYRERLEAAAGAPIGFAFLDGNEALIAARLSAREHHFMPQGLLHSQFETLERPGAGECALRVDIDRCEAAIIESIAAWVQGRN